MSRNVVNVLVGKLNDGQSKAMSIHVEFVKAANNVTIQSETLNACQMSSVI